MPAADTALRISYKAHSTGVITPGVEPVFSSDPGPTLGQQLRRVSSSLNFKKAKFQSNEITTHQQVIDARQGGKMVQGDLAVEISPLTFQDFWEASCRGTWAAGLAKSNTEFGSISITSGVATITTSTWAAQGFSVGMTLRFTNLSVSANNNKNFQIIALSGVTATLLPAPLDQVGDAAWNVTTPGRKVFIPESSHVNRKFAFEHYYSDIDIAHLFTECRIGGFRAQLAADSMCTASFPILGRNRTRFTTGTSPFFTGPPAIPTSSGLTTTFGGQLIVGGIAQAIITSVDFGLNWGLSAKNPAFNDLVTEIYYGDGNVDGTIMAEFNDDTLNGYFDAETEVEIALMITTSRADNADFVSMFMPRVKFFGDDLANAGKAGIPISLPFQALKKGTTTGYDATTLIIQDSLSA